MNIIDTLLANSNLKNIPSHLIPVRKPTFSFSDSALFSIKLDSFNPDYFEKKFINSSQEETFKFESLNFGMYIGLSDDSEYPKTGLVLFCNDKDDNSYILKNKESYGLYLDKEALFEYFSNEIESIGINAVHIESFLTDIELAHNYLNTLWATKGNHFSMEAGEFEDRCCSEQSEITESFHILTELSKAKKAFNEDPSIFPSYKTFSINVFENFLEKTGKIKTFNVQSFDMGLYSCAELDRIREFSI